MALYPRFQLTAPSHFIIGLTEIAYRYEQMTWDTAETGACGNCGAVISLDSGVCPGCGYDPGPGQLTTALVTGVLLLVIAVPTFPLLLFWFFAVLNALSTWPVTVAALGRFATVAIVVHLCYLAAVAGPVGVIYALYRSRAVTPVEWSVD